MNIQSNRTSIRTGETEREREGNDPPSAMREQQQQQRHQTCIQLIRSSEFPKEILSEYGKCIFI
jgi:hypothetical protein